MAVKSLRRGAFLSVMAVLFWAMMPVSSKGLLQVLDAYTLNFYRFVGSALILGIYLLYKQKPKVNIRLGVRGYLLFFVAVMGLLFNHLAFMDALNYVPAGTSQIIVQLGPVGLLLVSIRLFREHLRWHQVLGVTVFILGLVLFFNGRLVEITSMAGDYAIGVIYMTFAALIWIFYGAAQKALTGRVGAPMVLLTCYGLGALLLMPLSEINLIYRLDSAQLLLLTVCVVSSLAAYIFFAESIVYWETTKSSALLAVIPLATFAYQGLLAPLIPQYVIAESLNDVAVLGVAMVVLGCAMVAVTESRTPVGGKPQESR